MKPTENKKNWCVYKHQSPSGKVYIGITSQKAENRWGHGSNYRRNQYFYSAIKKYGWENIIHEVLFKNLDKQSAIQKEVELIALYRSNDQRYGYNLTSGGESGTRLSEETRRKLSEAHKGKKLGPCSEMRKRRISQSNKGKKKPHVGVPRSAECRKRNSIAHSKNVLQYTNTGDFVAEYISGKQASQKTGISASHISHVCKGLRKTAGGYYWKFKNN